jgi:hypothetical protein
MATDPPEGLRDQFAIAALPDCMRLSMGVLARLAEQYGLDPETEKVQTVVAITAYKYADAMMKAREVDLND